MTDTEVEAYILEANLINKYQPVYNIRLKDDKTYPYIKVTLNEDFPRILKTRIVKNDGAKYYGPFTNVENLHRIIDILKDVYKLRTCRKDLKAGKPEKRPCLNYHIGKCLGPCIGGNQPGRLPGQGGGSLPVSFRPPGRFDKKLEEEMYQAAEEMNFERAAHLRIVLRL